MFTRLAALAALPLLAFAQSDIAGNGTGIDKNGKYAISSEGIRANFIAYGASISNLFIEDIHGEVRDIVLGFDSTLTWAASLAATPTGSRTRLSRLTARRTKSTLTSMAV
jgi:hypothetical protein